MFQLAKRDQVLKAFDELWSLLFRTPVHLDSALSKQPPHLKSVLAQCVPEILLKPVALAESLGIGVPAGEPWSLDPEKLAAWKPARLMMERLYEGMSSGIPEVAATLEDFPPWMTDEWKAAWSDETVQSLVRALASRAPLSLRAARDLTAETLYNDMTEAGRLPVQAKVSDISPLGVHLSGYVPVMGSELYQAGKFEIQDEGSQVMALFALWPEAGKGLLEPEPGRRGAMTSFVLPKPPTKNINVVDACAGAGGKTLALADALAGRGRVYAYDTSEKKLQALRRRATRAGLNNIQAVALEENSEEKSLERFRESADVVLVDAPCTGWGVLRRNPDIKWRQSPASRERMPLIQTRLLALYSSLVKPGGRLVFGVCTFRPAETTAIVEAFLEEHPEFTALEGGFLGPDPSDGFYMQGFARK